MAICFFDVETAGWDGGVVELGSVILTDSGERYYFNERCKPHIPITDGAFKCHGISNEDVADKRPAQEVVDEWISDLKSLGEDVILCAHNLQFDVRMISHYVDLSPFRKFCSLILARELYPEMPKHKLGILYAALGFTEQVRAHSALDDCIMLERIVSKMIYPNHYSVFPALQDRPPKMLDKVTFGQHKGKKFIDLPTDYLVWARDKHDNKDVSYTAEKILEQRK